MSGSVDQRPAEPARVGALWVRADHLRFDELRGDLALRLEDVSIVPFSADRPAGPGLVVFVDVTPADESERLTLVVSDGRAYDRTVPRDPENTPQEHRQLVARSIASLISGVEAGTEAPDRDGVPLPPAALPSLVCPEPPLPAPPGPVPAAAPEASPTREPPRVELGPALNFGALVGLGPPANTDRFAAFSGSVGVSVRWRRGAMLVVDGRVAGRSHPLESRLLRLRAAVGGGYSFRPDQSRVEVVALAGASVEPWLVFRDGARVTFGGRALPAIGAWARGGVGYLLRNDARVAVRLGSWVEFAASYIPGQIGPIARISGVEDERTVPMFRVGGPELSLGLGTTVWFGRR